MNNLDKALNQFNKIAAKEKLFQREDSWGKVEKNKNTFNVGDVVSYNGIEVITTGDGAFSTYLKKGQVGVIIENLAFGELYLVSWEIGGGYMATSPVKKNLLTKTTKRVEKKKLRDDQITDDVLIDMINPKLKPLTTTPQMKIGSSVNYTKKALNVLRENRIATNFLSYVILQQEGE